MSDDLSTGVLKKTKRGGFVLRDPKRSFRRGPTDAVVPQGLARRFRLVEGAAVTGPVAQRGNRLELADVASVCGLSPEAFQNRTPFEDLTALDPTERFNLGAAGERSMRVVDLIAPIGKGTRGLIVSPPKAGKTVILEQMANGMMADDPDTRVLVLLIDERPEEVTHFRRAVKAEVLASSNDHGVEEHVELAELTMAHVRTELECGRDVVVLVDSLTRMGRTFNLNQGNRGRGRGRGRTMSGGMGVGAMEIPRRFFGMARNVEDGGSVTIIATALIDTGSRMDDLIFEEFKGTGNSEIVLDRQLADRRIFPAINITASGTRKEERLFGPDGARRIGMLRRVMAEMRPAEAMAGLLKLVDRHATNDELLASFSRGA